MNSTLNKNLVAKKVIIWRVFSIVVCTLTARIWFGDWHTTLYGIFLTFFLTILHYWFEIVWELIVNGKRKQRKKRS